MALLTKVKARIAIHAHRKARSLLDGEYKSFQSGRSMDFQDLREYVVGDDVKDLDWKASARKGDLLIRRYHADRKHTVQLCVAGGRSMAALASTDDTKSDIAVLVTGAMGYLATRHGDYVGLVVNDGNETHAMRPATTEVALERMLARIVAASAPGTGDTDLTATLAYVARTVRRRTILVVVMDDVDLTAADLDLFKRLRVQHEVLVMSIGDLDLTDEGLTDRSLVDVTDGDPVPDFLLGDQKLRAEVAERTAERIARRSRELTRLAIAHEHISEESDVVSAIFRLLERHRHVGA